MGIKKAPYSAGTYIWLVLNLITSFFNLVVSLLLVMGASKISHIPGGNGVAATSFLILISSILCLTGICMIFKRNPKGRKIIIIYIGLSVFIQLISIDKAALLGMGIRILIWYFCLKNIKENEAIKIL